MVFFVSALLGRLMEVSVKRELSVIAFKFSKDGEVTFFPGVL